MRVLITSTGGLGHVQPMLPLARRLAARGHPVLWATAAPGLPRLAAEGIETVGAGLAEATRMAEYRRRWPEGASLQGEARAEHQFPRGFGAVSTPPMFRDLLPIARSWGPDVIVSEAAELAAPIVARALHVPQVTHGFGLVVPPERLQAAADQAAELWAAIGEEPQPYGGCYDTLYLDIYPRSLQPEDLSRIPHIQLVRPTSHTRIGDEAPSAGVQAAIADGRPLVYLTFGTVFNVNDTFHAAVEALAATTDVVVVVTVGPTGDVDAFGPQPSHITIERYVAQSDLLDHAAVVVSHGGSGTLLGAMAMGIPQVILPQAADQLRNARACARSGAGIALFGDDATLNAIRAAVVEAMSNPAIQAAAERLETEIASMPTVDDAISAIAALGIAEAAQVSD